MLSEIVMAVIDAGLTLELLTEHDSVPRDALPGMMVADVQVNTDWCDGGSGGVRSVQRNPEVVSPWTRKRFRNKKTTSIGRIAISEPMKSSG